MPRIPVVSTLDANSVGILNTIRDEASPEYRNAIPVAEATTESIRYVGTQILAHQNHRNEFINALVNRIAMELVTSRMYENPLAAFKRGYLELGETVEEIFVNIAKPFQYDPADAENTVFKRELPDVKTMFHAMNYQKYYTVPISNQQLRQAFLSMQGLTDFVMWLVNSMYSGANYDEFLMTKYLIATLIIGGTLPMQYVNTTSDSTKADKANHWVETFKKAANDLTFMDTQYNIAGVLNFCPKENQHIIMTSDINATIDVNSLAKAFNVQYDDFIAKQWLVNSFSFTDAEQARIGEILADDPTFIGTTVFSDDNLALLAKITAVVCDERFLMLFDNLIEDASIVNPKGLNYINYHHVWKTISASPFANVVAFMNDTALPAVTLVGVTGDASVAKGYTGQYEATVTGAAGANLGVYWSMKGYTNYGEQTQAEVTLQEDTRIGGNGQMYVSENETATTIVVTATSANTSTVKGTKAVTIT